MKVASLCLTCKIRYVEKRIDFITFYKVLTTDYMKFLKIIEKVIYIVLGIILLILPFPRGLFFEREILPVQLVIYLLFVLWAVYKLIKKEKILINSYLAIAVCILPIAYILPVLFGYAVNVTDAINYIMRYMSYLIVFIIISDMTKSKDHLKIWLYFIALSGIISALLGIDSLAGKVVYQNNLVGGAIADKLGILGIGFQWNRLQGIMQYANTSGMYYASIFFILIAISIFSEKKYIKVICSGAMFLMLTVVMLTISRGAILLLPIVYLIILIFLTDKTQKIELVLITIAPIIITLIIYPFFQSASPALSEVAGSGSKVWILAVIGIAVSSIATYAFLYLTEFLNKISEKKYNIAFVVIISVLVILMIVLWFTGAYTKIIPQELIDRFLQTGSQATSGRGDFYRDGFNVLKDNWLLGAGGGAWNSLYRIYQSYNYGSTEAHNMLLQVWIETGVIGIITYIFMLLSALKIYIDCRRKNNNIDVSVLLLAIVIYIIAHSMIDFNFSYFSVPILVFVILGSLNGICQSEEDNNILKNLKLPAWSAGVVGSCFVIVAVCFSMARMYASEATSILKVEQLTSQELTKASEKMQSATKLNPWNVNFYIMEKATDADMSVDLNTIYNIIEQVDTNNETILKLHNSVITKAVKLNPKNPSVNIKSAQFMLGKAGDFEKGLEYVENALKYNPMDRARYEETADAYSKVGMYYMGQKNNAEAEKYLKRVIELENDLEKVNQRALQPVVFSESTLNYIQTAKEILNQ